MTTPRKTPAIRAVRGAPVLAKCAEQPSTPMVGAGSLVAFSRDADGKRVPVECVTVRTYYNPRGNGLQPVRACVWVSAPYGSAEGDHRTGRGSASGCGYHKESAAIAEAIKHAGFDLFGSPYTYAPTRKDRARRFYLGGTGSSAYADVFKAIARAQGFRGPMTWVSHGL